MIIQLHREEVGKVSVAECSATEHRVEEICSRRDSVRQRPELEPGHVEPGVPIGGCCFVSVAPVRMTTRTTWPVRGCNEERDSDTVNFAAATGTSRESSKGTCRGRVQRATAPIAEALPPLLEKNGLSVNALADLV